ncbi:MAG: ABC transporter ATP-binding protein [Thermoprotei archaeon]
MKLIINGITVYYDSIRALENVSLETEAGEVTFVIGPNGAGKTTLLKTIASIIKPRGGAIYLDGRELSSYSSRELGKILSYVDPHISRSLPATVLEFLLTARYPHRNPFELRVSPKDLEVIDRVSRQFNIQRLLDRRLDQLSSGEFQRVLLARAFAQEPRILLLDEPSAFLDLRYKLEVLEYVKRTTRENMLVSIIAIHDIYLASIYADKIIVLDKGRIAAAGKPGEVLRKDIIEKIYGVEVSLINIDDKTVVIPLKPISNY